MAGLIAAAIAFSVAPVRAQELQAPAEADWAKAMFDHTSHDFGMVARGAKVEYRFVVKNPYNEDMQIESVRSSCGCSAADATKQHLKGAKDYDTTPFDQAEIVVRVDTRGALGRKDATITVKFGPPFAAEVQLHLHVYIRSDVVVQPGAAQFGVVNQGTAAEQVLAVNYAGRDDWQILRVECADPHIEAAPVETSRRPGLVDYKVVVKLKADAPPGYIQDRLVLVTNDYDPKAAHVPVAVEGMVAAALSASPVWMGVAEAGQTVTRNLVVRGRTPFRILTVRSTDARFQCQAPAGPVADHYILPVTFRPKGPAGSAGRVAGKIRIETDLPGSQPIEVPVSIQIAPATATP
jgi:hypothetical protein